MKTIVELLTLVIPDNFPLVLELGELIHTTGSEQKFRPILENMLPKPTGIMLVEGEEWEEEEWDTPTERKELPIVEELLLSAPTTPALSSHQVPTWEGWLLVVSVVLLSGVWLLAPARALAWWLLEQ